MSKKKKTATDLLKDPLKKMDGTLQERKDAQKSNQDRYKEALEQI